MDNQMDSLFPLNQIEYFEDQVATDQHISFTGAGSQVFDSRIEMSQNLSSRKILR